MALIRQMPIASGGIVLVIINVSHNIQAPGHPLLSQVMNLSQGVSPDEANRYQSLVGMTYFGAECDALIIFGVFLLLLDFIIYFDGGVLVLRKVRSLPLNLIDCVSYSSLKVLLPSGVVFITRAWYIRQRNVSSTRSEDTMDTRPFAPLSSESHPSIKSEPEGQGGLSEPTAIPTLASLFPSTLLEWRSSEVCPPRSVWAPLESWFETQGLYLYADCSSTGHTYLTRPQDTRPRVPDGTFIYSDIQAFQYQTVCISERVQVFTL